MYESVYTGRLGSDITRDVEFESSPVPETPISLRLRNLWERLVKLSETSESVADRVQLRRPETAQAGSAVNDESLDGLVSKLEAVTERAERAAMRIDRAI